MGNTARAVVGALVATLTLAVATACSDTSEATPSETEPDTSTTTSTTTAPTDSDAARFPGDEWDTTDPVEAGFDPAALDALATTAEAAGSACLVVIRDGQVVAEHNWPGPDTEPREAYSVTKSLTSTLVGIAADQGDLRLDDRASTYIPSWAGTPSADVTVENLLANSSGRKWDLVTDYGGMAIGAEDKTAFAIGLGQDAPPGQVWAYNNSAIQTLSAVLTEATGEHPSDFAAAEVFEPLGMADSSLSRDPAGNALMFMGLKTTCLDLARFGLLMLQDGEWNGEQVISSEYVEQATGRSSTDLNNAYGLLWWLNRPGTIASPTLATTGTGDQNTKAGPILADAPTDIFWALGLNNQTLAVIPDEGVIAVRLGAKPPAGTPFSQVELTRGVLDALVDR